MRHHGTRICAALSVMLSLAACTTLKRGDSTADETEVVTVTVVNHHPLNVTVFSVAQGRRDRLGEVTTAASSSFKVHMRRLPGNEMQLLADPVGSSRTTTSELLHVGPGDTVQWILETDLARSHVQIR